jgi:hypothetical protein
MDTLKVKKKDRKIILWVKMLGGIDVLLNDLMSQTVKFILLFCFVNKLHFNYKGPGQF